VRRGVVLALLLVCAALACDNLSSPSGLTPARSVERVIHTPKPQPTHLRARVAREQIPVCRRPMDLALSADGKKLFVACPGSNQLVAVDTERLDLAWAGQSGQERLYRVVADPKRDRVYAIGMNGRFLTAFDGGTGEEIKQLAVGSHIADLALVPGKDRLVVTATNPPQASLIDLARLAVDGEVLFPSPPGSLAMRDDGLLGAVSCGLWEVTVGGTRPMFEPIYLFDPNAAGRAPEHLGFGGMQARQGLFTRGGLVLLVPGRQSATVSVFSVSNRQLLTTIQVGAAPEKIVATPNGLWAFTQDTGAASTTRIDLIRYEASGRVALPNNPQDLIIAPDGVEAYATLPGADGAPGQVAIIDVENLVVVALVRVGQDPCRLLASPNGRRLYVADFLSNTVSIVE
jgi:DNA-binding beta-propeller fold protein YncE